MVVVIVCKTSKLRGQPASILRFEQIKCGVLVPFGGIDLEDLVN